MEEAPAGGGPEGPVRLDGDRPQPALAEGVEGVHPQSASSPDFASRPGSGPVAYSVPSATSGGPSSSTLPSSEASRPTSVLLHRTRPLRASSAVTPPGVAACTTPPVAEGVTVGDPSSARRQTVRRAARSTATIRPPRA